MDKGPQAPVTHALSASQADFGDDCKASCGMIATLFCHCLLSSPSRDKNSVIRALDRWMAVGCWLYRTRRAQLCENTSVNPHHKSKSLYLSPGTLIKTIPEIGASMHPEEELGGVLYSNVLTADVEFGAADAFVPLEHVVVRMAMLARVRRVAATIVTNGNASAISMSLVTPSMAEELPEPEPTGSASEAMDLLDIVWEGRLNIDFVDSHFNFMPQHPRGGTGVWIQFGNLSSLCAYIRSRYPPDERRSTEEVASDIMKDRPNSFEVCLWKNVEGSDSEYLTPLLSLALSLSDNPGFKAWRSTHGPVRYQRRVDENRKKRYNDTDLQHSQASTRQRIENSIKRLCEKYPTKN